MWILGSKRGPIPIERQTEGALLAGGRIYHVLPSAGDMARRVALWRRLEGLHPLLPASGETAWARSGPDRPWMPVYGVRPPTGEPLAGAALSLDLFWAVVPPVVEMLRLARLRGLTLRRLPPEAVLLTDGAAAAVDAPFEWMLTIPGHEPTQVAAQFIHWFLRALRQTPAAGEIPSPLWALCTRALEGGYARTGLFKLEQDLQQVSQRRRPGTGTKKACLVLDQAGVKEATGAYLHPWLTLEALWQPGLVMDPLVVVQEGELPRGLAAMHQEARFVPHSLLWHFGPKQLLDILGLRATPEHEVILVSGRRDWKAIRQAFTRAGYRCRLIGFERADGVENGMDHLQAALHLAAGQGPDHMEGKTFAHPT